MKKRIFWLLALLVASLCVLTVSAGAYTEDIVASDTCGENLTWTIYGDGIMVISGEGPMEEFEWGYEAAPWWLYADYVTSLRIEEGVTTVSDYAFQYCPLEEVSLPETLTHIGQWAFSNSYFCDLVLPDSVEYIGDYAFESCSELVNLHLGEGRIELGEYAFSNCYNLFSVIIPYGTTELPFSLFERCETLNWIVLPATVTTIGENAFYDCFGLWTVFYGGTEDMWNNVDINYAGNDPLQPANPEFPPEPGMGGTATLIYGTPISVKQTTGGTASVNKPMAAPYEVVTVTATADEGYEFSHVLVNGVEIEGMKFEAYESNGMTVSAVFTEAITAPSVDVEIPTENGASPEFTIDTSAITGTDNYAVITVGGKTERVEQSDWADGKISYSGLAAKDLTQTVTMGVYDGSGNLLTEQSVSVAETLKEQLKTEADTKEIAKIEAMLHYGAAAQQYFGTNTENLANSGISAMADVSAHRKDESLLKGTDFSMICGTSMVHGATPQMKFYFTTNSKTVRINGEEVELEASADGYYFCTVDVAPVDFFETITVAVMDGDSTLATITDSVASYCARLYAQGGELSQTLADALLNYGIAVKA